jgi:HEAT repeat protein
MSDGDESEEDAEAPEGGEDAALETTLSQRLEDAEADLGAAETEADLDEVAATLDAVAADLEDADLPEPDDEDGADPAAELEERLSDLRADLDEQRGPYAADVTEAIADARSTVESTRWTADGTAELGEAVRDFLDAVGEELDADPGAAGEDPEEYATVLETTAETVKAAELDADEDAETLAALVEAVSGLTAGVEDAEEYDDLSVREKLRAEGFYDALGQKHKDFPPEWSALKEWEKRDDVEMVLLLLDLMGDSEFIERHCLESLERMANEDAVDAMLERAERRDQDAIRVIGKTGTAREDVLDALHEFVDGDPALQRVVLKALGRIGAEASTRPVADRLAADDARVRSQAARALGLIGDPRAVAPLTDVLAEEGTESVRASAAWALVQIGTETALEAAAEYADDRSYVVQSEAEAALEALDAEAPTA